VESNNENKKLGFWSKIVSSVQGIKHYDAVLKESVGKSILYLLLIALVLGTVGTIRGAIDINNGISTFIKMYNQKCPNFELKNGELSVKGNMPLILSQDKNNYVVIDTTNSTNPDVLDSYSQGILILKDKMIQKKNNSQTTVTEFKSLNGITINKELVNEWLPLANFIIPFYFLKDIIWYFLGGLLSALILAFFALIINGGFKTNLTYGQLYRISIYGLTTPLIIDTLFKIFDINFFSFYRLVYHVIAFGYVCFALYRLKKSQNNTAINC
jgi:hypothetical protein